MNALKKAAKQLSIEVPVLADYRVRIPPGGRTGALVETTITWVFEKSSESNRQKLGETFSTLGVDPDQLGAAIIATEKMLNAVITRRRDGRARGNAKNTPRGASRTPRRRGTETKKRASD